MSLNSELQDLADLCQVSAQRNLSFLIAMGPRPADGAAAAAWDLGQSRLRGQIDRLTTSAIELSGLAVVTGLETANEDLASLRGVTKAASDRIKQIQTISQALTIVGAVLDVGLAVMTLAAGPTPANGLALLQKAGDLRALVEAAAEA